MVEHERDRERAGEATEETGLGEVDPTLDIVRRLIVEAEARPAPARRPSGPATPRPDGPAIAAAAAVSVPPSVPDPAPAPDAGPEDWDDDLDDTWEDLTSGGSVRPYGIVDIETGEVVGLDGSDAEEEFVAEPVAPRRAGKRAAGRWLGGALHALAAGVSGVLRGFTALMGAVVRALGSRVGAGFAAARRVAVRFLRRPDAPRRLAVALLVIFVIAWPWKVLWLTLLIPLAALITWASVGNDGCVELIVRWHARLKARDPDKAERIRLRAKAVSAALERGLERLPERWTHGIYLPDFEPEGYVPEKLQVDPFEELAARVHSAKRAGGG